MTDPTGGGGALRVLVTGAAGAVGSVVVDELRAHGHDVVALVRAGEDLPRGVDGVRGDAADPEVTHRATEGVDAVVHLAAIPAPIGPAEGVFSNNVSATHAVLEAAGATGVRTVVIASSVSALGLAFGRRHLRPAYVPVDEAHPLQVEDPYALSKQVDEMTAEMMGRRWGTGVTAFRLPFVGKGDRLAQRVQQAQEDPGSLTHDLWGYIRTEDAARAFRLAVEAGVAGHHVVNIAAPDTVCELETAALLERYLPGVPVRVPPMGRSTLLTTDRARTLFGFEAELSWREV